MLAVQEGGHAGVDGQLAAGGKERTVVIAGGPWARDRLGPPAPSSNGRQSSPGR